MRMLTCRDCKGTGYKPIELLTREIVKPLGDKRGWVKELYKISRGKYDYLIAVEVAIPFIDKLLAQTRQETIDSLKAGLPKKKEGDKTGFDWSIQQAYNRAIDQMEDKIKKLEEEI